MFQLIKFSLKTLFYSALLICIVAGGLFGLHRFADNDQKLRIERFALDCIDVVRESKAAPPELVFLLDICYDHIPLSVGNVVPIEFIESDATFPGGYPQSLIKQNLTRLVRIGYTVAYDEEKRNPAWVAYSLFKPQTTDSGRRPDKFLVDMDTRIRVQPQAYTNTGYDRGHMAPNYGIAVCYGPKAQEQTFLMSNIAPQRPKLNKGIWKDVEMREISRYAERFEKIWIITGPVYSKIAISNFNEIAVPEAFFKIVIDQTENGYRALGFIIPQDASETTPLSNYLVSIREIEERTGLNFFPKWKPENQKKMESAPATRIW